ncbi:hypothetical protein GEMRC1_007176 [Eukaryota sp. GEM-RC1]
MWSLGCVLAELNSGVPIFPGEDERDQIQCIMEVLGPPPNDLVTTASRKKLFFDSIGNPIITANSRGRKRKPGTRDLAQAVRSNNSVFIDFIKQCLVWDPAKRMMAHEALGHPFIRDLMDQQDKLPPI